MISVRRLVLLAALTMATAVHAQTSVTADLRAYGVKCGTIQIIPTNPLLGKPMSVTVRSQDARTGLLAVGFKRVNLAIGNGCTLYTDLLLQLRAWASATPGTGTVTQTLPNDKNLLGFKFTIQVTANNSTGFAMSRGVEGTIGNKAPIE